jgi:hypothetical protein
LATSSPPTGSSSTAMQRPAAAAGLPDC